MPSNAALTVYLRTSDILEGTIYENVKELFSNENFIENMIDEAQKIHEGHSFHKEISNMKKKIIGYEGNEMALTERLAELPPNV